MLGTVMQQSMFLSNTGIHINYDVDNGHDDLGSDEDDNNPLQLLPMAMAKLFLQHSQQIRNHV